MASLGVNPQLTTATIKHDFVSIAFKLCGFGKHSSGCRAWPKHLCHMLKNRPVDYFRNVWIIDHLSFDFLELFWVLKCRVAQIKSDAAFPLHFPRVLTSPLPALGRCPFFANTFMTLPPGLAQPFHVTLVDCHQAKLGSARSATSNAMTTHDVFPQLGT